MGIYPPFYWCPEGLADCWWRPFVNDEIKLQIFPEKQYQTTLARYDDHDWANSRMIAAGGKEAHVFIIRDNLGVFDKNRSLWVVVRRINDREILKWIAQVLLASGAKRENRFLIGCKAIFQCPHIHTNNLQSCLQDFAPEKTFDAFGRDSWKILRNV